MTGKLLYGGIGKKKLWEKN